MKKELQAVTTPSTIKKTPRQRNSYYEGYVQRFIAENIVKGKRVLDLDPQQYLKQLSGAGKFDYVLMVDLLDHLDDIWDVLKETENRIQEGSVLIITALNPLWQPIFSLAEKLKWMMPVEKPYNFIHRDNIINLLEIFDYTIIKKDMFFIAPKEIRGVSDFLNWIMPKIPVLKNLCAIQAIVAKKEKPSPEEAYSCSVIIPCHNEEGNVARCAESIPQMGNGTEVIFVNDGSTDGTHEKLVKLASKYPHIKVVSYEKNQGKGYAVRRGFDAATGDILMIFDADLTVPGHDLHEFYYPFAHHKAKFVNGSRLVYPLEHDSMRTLNLWGNQFFGMLMSWLIGQRLTDTLCGTKAFFKKDYLKMTICMDRWGDFDFLFSTEELNLKLVEIPIHYKRREAGVSKMRTFRHGLLLTRVCIWGFFNVKLKSIFRKLFSGSPNNQRAGNFSK